LYVGPVEGNRVSGYCGSAGSICSLYIVDLNRISSDSFHFSSLRSTYVVVVVIHHGIVDDSGVVVYFYFGFVGSVVPIRVVVMDAVVGNKYPVETGDVYTHLDGYTWPQRSPAVVSPATSPVDPSRSPVIAGDPSPALEIVVEVPASVVEWCPTPVVIGYPSIAVFGHYPVSLGAVGMKIAADCGEPDVAVSGIFYPVSVGRKFIIENLKAYGRLFFCFCL
jgi:hypothetical protein